MSARTGLAGTLPFAVLFVGLVAAVAAAQLMRSGQTLDQATRDAGGAACEEAAIAAVEEGAWRLGRALTDPTSEAYWHVRRELVRGTRPYLDLASDLDPEHLRARLAAGELPPLFRHMKIESFRAVWHVPKAGTPIDQVVDFECGVSLALAGKSVYRRAVQRRRYGVVHVSPPKPFDQLSFAIAEHSFLTELPRHRARRARMLFSANALAERYEWIRHQIRPPGPDGGMPPAAPRVLPSLAPTLAGVPVREPQAAAPAGPAALSGAATGEDPVELAFAPPFLATRRAPAMPAETRRALEEMLSLRRATDRSTDDQLARMTAEERAWEEWRIVGPHAAAQVRVALARQTLPRGETVWAELPTALLRREAPSPDSVVFSMEPEVDLAAFDYEARIAERERTLVPELEQASEAVNSLWAGFVGPRAQRMSGAELARAVDQLRTLSQLVAPKMKLLIEELERQVAHALAHTRAGFSTQSLEAYRGRASKRLRAFGLHVDDQRGLDEALERYPTFNGHLSASGKTPLKLKAPEWSGKAVISVKPPRAGESAPPLVVEELRCRRPAEDLVVLDAPRVELAGSRIDAALVVEDRLAFRGRAHEIHGNLLMRRLRPLGERAADEELKGTVVFDPKVGSGPLLERRKPADEPTGFGLDHLVVTLCPRDLKRAVHRTPEDK